MRVGVDVGLLHHVLGLALVAEDGARRPVETLVVPPHQHLEQRGLPVEHADHHLLVGQHRPSVQHCPAYHVHVFLRVSRQHRHQIDFRILDQVGLLPGCEVQIEELVVVIHDGRQIRRAAVVEVWRMLPQPAQWRRAVLARGRAVGVAGILTHFGWFVQEGYRSPVDRFVRR